MTSIKQLYCNITNYGGSYMLVTAKLAVLINVDNIVCVPLKTCSVAPHLCFDRVLSYNAPHHTRPLYRHTGILFHSVAQLRNTLHFMHVLTQITITQYYNRNTIYRIAVLLSVHVQLKKAEIQTHFAGSCFTQFPMCTNALYILWLTL